LHRPTCRAGVRISWKWLRPSCNAAAYSARNTKVGRCAKTSASDDPSTDMPPALVLERAAAPSLLGKAMAIGAPRTLSDARAIGRGERHGVRCPHAAAANMAALRGLRRPTAAGEADR